MLICKDIKEEGKVMNSKKNAFTALVSQIITILYGLIIPRIIISTFGSEINGMSSSITQFLSFISLLEGGLGAVILAELYLPIEASDTLKVKEILCACQRFFSELALYFMIYTFIVAIVYSITMQNKYDFVFTSSLVLILSFSTLSQYLFAITNRLLLQALQKIYIVNIVSAGTLLINLIITLIIINFFPEIHVLKLGSSIAFLIQPIIFNHYVDKKYKIDCSIKHQSHYNLKNRWSGFGQNLAHFINMNTDIAVITILVGLKEVSVYSVYMLAINALRTLISTVDNSYQSALGKYYAAGNRTQFKTQFKKFECINNACSLIVFCTCLILISPFVSLYTQGISDISYYRPLFGLVMVMANLIYCLREPYRLVVLASGKFKETNAGAIIEAFINIFLSLILVKWGGLLGIAMGTLIAITYRFIYLLLFLKRDVLDLTIRDIFSSILKSAIIIVINIIMYSVIEIKIESFAFFVLYGAIFVIIETVLVSIIYFVPQSLQKLVKTKGASKK